MLLTLFVTLAVMQLPDTQADTAKRADKAKRADTAKQAGTLKRSGTIKKLLHRAIHEGDEGADSKVSRLPFTSATIRQIVLSHQPQVQGCYEEYLAMQRKKNLEGLLKTQWYITREGFVRDVLVLPKESTLHDANLHRCVIAVLSTMVFPKPPEGEGTERLIQFPFNLKAVH